MRRRTLMQAGADEYVDFGLPSGTLWAKGNLCKDSNGDYYIGDETERGTFMTWGNIVSYNEGDSYSFTSSKYNSTEGKNVTADIAINDADHDIVLAKLGAPWHMPTKEQIQELYDNTDNEWVADYKGSGFAGVKFMMKTNHSVYIFLRASGYWGNSTSITNSNTHGYYWSRSWNSETYASNLRFSDGATEPLVNAYRYYARPVRPVCFAFVDGYTIDQTNATASPTDIIVKPIGASMNLSPDEDIISWIHENTKIVAAELSLSNGKLVCKEVSKTDKTKFKDGTSITASGYDIFVKLPEFWWSCAEASTNVFNIRFSKTSVSGWNHWEGNIFIGVYEAFDDDDNKRIYSRSGVTPTVDTLQSTLKTHARNKGTGYTLISYEAHCMMALLGYGWIGSTNVQSVCGKGTSSYPKTTGGCDSLGMTDTVAGGNGDSGSTNFWGIENWWGDVGEWVDNINSYNYKIYVLNDNGNTVRNITTGITSSADAHGCIGRMKLGQYGDLVPIEMHSNTYYNNGYCDYGSIGTTSSGSICARSQYSNNTNGGLGYINASDYTSSTSQKNDKTGTRIQYKGDYTIDGVEGTWVGKS